MTDWTGVRERVLALAEKPGGKKVFGAAGHHFALDAPLTAAEVAEAEAALGVAFPDDYRSFLLHVGAGGAGPAYGVFPLWRKDSGDWRWGGRDATAVEPAVLAEAFPGGSDPLAVAGILAERPDWEEFEDPDDLDAALETWQSRLAEAGYDARSTPGAVPLCTEGCGLMVWLAVTGSERGRMWSDQRCDDMEWYPVRHSDGSPLGFADWYLGWLAEAEAACGGRKRKANPSGPR